MYMAVQDPSGTGLFPKTRGRYGTVCNSECLFNRDYLKKTRLEQSWCNLQRQEREYGDGNFFSRIS
jgi:hypothetical protein